MATLKTIAAAIKLIDTKKENLKSAYDDLQAHSSLLSSPLSLSWSDLDAHFSSVQNSLTQRFGILESLESTQAAQQDPSSLSNPPAPTNPSTQSVSTNPQDLSSPLAQTSVHRVDSVPTGSELVSSSVYSRPELRDPSCSSNPPSKVDMPAQDRVDSVVSRPELRALCEKMDGKGLRKYVNERSKEREAIRVELPDAMRYAPDPGAMVLDAMEGFYEENSRPGGDRDPELSGVRRGCVLLLERLMEINPNLGVEVRERAKQLAFEWKGKVNGENPLEALGFLHLVAAYRLGSEFDMNEFVDYLVVVARYRQGTLLCRAIGLGDKVSDLIQKLLENGKQLLAIKFIFEFQMTVRFPPAPLLKTYLNESKIAANKVCKEGKNSLRAQNEAIAKELSALRAVIKVIEEHKLESEYPPEGLQKRIDLLEKRKSERKRPATVPAAKPQQQQAKQQPKKQQSKKQQQSGSKRPRKTAPIGPSAVPMNVGGANSTIPPFQQPHLHQAGLLPDHSAAYLSSAPGPYGLVGSTPTVAPYAGSSAGLYGLAGAPMGFPANSSPAGSHLYSSESQMASGYYDRPTAYGGYALPPQYHPAYYPQ